jgi:lactoylglutathione lyase
VRTAPIAQGVQRGHAGLNMSDLNRSLPFYLHVFDLEVLGESPDPGHRYVFLGSGGDLVLTLWEQSEGRFSASHPGLHHLAFRSRTSTRFGRLKPHCADWEPPSTTKESCGTGRAATPPDCSLKTRMVSGWRSIRRLALGMPPAPTQSTPACGFV